MRTEKVYKDSIPADIRAAARAMLRDWLPTLPPGYRSAPAYTANAPFDRARNVLSSQIHEGRRNPLRRHDEWHLMPHGYQGFFDCKTVTHVLVPIGSEPIIPWFGESAAAWSVSTRAMVKHVMGHGYELVPGGKGSHIKLTASGKRMIIIPANRESLSPKVLSSVATVLGLPSMGTLRALVQ